MNPKKTTSKAAAAPKTASKAAPKGSVGRVIGAAVDLVKLTLSESTSKTSESTSKTATSLLKSQHDEVSSLFKRLEAASTRAAKVKLFEELAHNLVAHDAIEREIFYPACERALGMTDLLGEALVEHGVVEFCLFQAEQAEKASDFSFKCQVLKEIVEHHVKEEERDFFPKVEKAVSKPELERLGARMKARFDEAKATDFRAPLHENLEQVLAGALKPTKPRSKAGKKSRASAPPRSARQRKAA